MSSRRRRSGGPGRLAVAPLAVLALLAACDSGAPASGNNRVLPGNPEPTSGPYVVVAVDNHFHDIHPEDRNVIRSDQPFVVKNEGRNLHNFTVIGTQVNVDLEPGQELDWSRIGDHLKPATWVVVCRYHAYLGMIGLFTVTP